MAENTVVKEQLTDSMIQAGAELTRKLGEMGLPISAAFWLFDPEVNEWRLLFASSEVSTKGSSQVYERIRLALQPLGEKAAAAPLSVIGLLNEHAGLIKSLRSEMTTGPEIGCVRFSKNVIGGHFIEDALIYRVA